MSDDSVIHWIFGSIGGAVTGVFGAIFKRFVTNLDTMSIRIQELELTEAAARQARDDMLARLTRIETKLDAIIVGRGRV